MAPWWKFWFARAYCIHCNLENRSFNSKQLYSGVACNLKLNFLQLLCCGKNCIQLKSRNSCKHCTNSVEHSADILVWWRGERASRSQPPARLPRDGQIFLPPAVHCWNDPSKFCPTYIDGAAEHITLGIEIFQPPIVWSAAPSFYDNIYKFPTDATNNERLRAPLVNEFDQCLSARKMPTKFQMFLWSLHFTHEYSKSVSLTGPTHSTPTSAPPPPLPPPPLPCTLRDFLGWKDWSLRRHWPYW